LTSLKPVKSLKSAIKLFQDIKKLVDAMELDKIAAIAAPNELRPGLFEGTQMVFNEGWPRVNRSRLPCVGIVIAFNLESGALHAVNVNMLPECQ